MLRKVMGKWPMTTPHKWRRTGKQLLAMAPKHGLTPAEKWKRLNNPKDLSDYAICMTEAEMKRVPAARKLLRQVRAEAREAHKVALMCKKMSDAAADMIDRIRLAVLTKAIMSVRSEDPEYKGKKRDGCRTRR